MTETAPQHDTTQEPVIWVVQETAQYARVPVWLVKSRVSDRALRLYTVLAGIYAGMPDMYPARRTLAEDMGCSVRTVDAAIDDLIAVGGLRVEPRSDHGGQRSNRYILAFDRPFTPGESRTILHPPAQDVARAPSQDVAPDPDKRMNQINVEPDRGQMQASAPPPRPEWLEAPLPRSLSVEALLAIEADYSGRARRSWVREQINAALNHKAVDKRRSANLYLRNWLNRDLKAAGGEQSPGRQEPQPPPPPAATRTLFSQPGDPSRPVAIRSVA